MKRKVCKIIPKDKIDKTSLKLRRTPRGDAILSGKVEGVDGDTTIAIHFSDGVNSAIARDTCNAFSGDYFEDQVSSFSMDEDIPQEEMSVEEFEAFMSASIDNGADEEVQINFASDIQKEGSSYNVVVVRAGETLAYHRGKPITFGREVLKQAVPLFEGSKVSAYRTGSFFDHLENLNPRLAKLFPNGMKDAEVGILNSVKFDSAKNAVVAVLKFSKQKQATFLDRLLRKANEKLGKLSNFMGLSVIIDILWRNGAPSQIMSCRGVDVVSIPAGGGHFETILQSAILEKEESDMRDQLIKKILGLNPKAEGLEELTDEALLSMFEDLSKGGDPPPLNVTRKDDASATHTVSDDKAAGEVSTRQLKKVLSQEISEQIGGLRDSMEESIASVQEKFLAQFALREAKANAVAEIEKSNLPKTSKDRLVSQVNTLQEIKEDTISTMLSTEAQFIEDLKKEEGFEGLGVDIEVGPDQVLKLQKAFAAEIGIKEEGIDEFGRIGLKKFWMELTGDYDLRGPEYTPRSKFATAVTADFPNTLANVLYKRMLQAFMEADYGEGALITEFRSATDFKTMSSVNVGGYGNFPTVNEGADYLDVTVPSDWKTEYAVAKKGGLMPITWEVIVNDDVGLVRRKTQEFGVAMRRTLADYVFGLMTSNPAMYDTNTLYHAAHSNLVAVALNAGAGVHVQLDAARTAMFNQTKPGTTAKLGLKPYHLFIPIELFALAVGKNQRQYLDDAFDPNTTWQMFGANNERIHTVPGFTDANDWYIVGDQSQSPFIEMAFLNGVRVPELLIQNNPTVANVFLNDTITYKIRFVFGGAVVEWRNTYAGLVA